MQSTPKALRLAIGIFGRRNVGKSSLLNAITGQQVSIVSPQPGTTADPIEKPMELLPLGPIVFIDTAGIDDEGALGDLRKQRSESALDRIDLGIIVTEAGAWGNYEEKLLEEFNKREVPALVVINKSDVKAPISAFISEIESKGCAIIACSAKTCDGILEAKDALLRLAQKWGLGSHFESRHLISDLVPPNEVGLLVVPIDSQAPKGRLILPQVMAIRDLLDGGSLPMVCQPEGIESALKSLNRPPALVVTDSQAFSTVSSLVPEPLLLTSFSVLMARLQGDLAEMARGAASIATLKEGDTILIAETCTHHPTGDDIGRVKIPAWLQKFINGHLDFVHTRGRDFPQDLSPYKLVIHCGNCTGNRREMLGRMRRCKEAGVNITNYGLAIAYSLGIFERAMKPFQSAMEALHATNTH